MNTAKTLEEYISLNLSENYQFIDEGDGYCDIMLCNIYDVTKNQYEKLIDLLSQQEIITPIYRIKFSYDISDYEYFYENNNDPNYICLTIYYDDEINCQRIGEYLINDINLMITYLKTVLAKLDLNFY